MTGEEAGRRLSKARVRSRKSLRAGLEGRHSSPASPTDEVCKNNSVYKSLLNCRKNDCISKFLGREWAPRCCPHVIWFTLSPWLPANYFFFQLIYKSAVSNVWPAGLHDCELELFISMSQHSGNFQAHPSRFQGLFPTTCLSSCC